jgi:hypothetical protein
MKRFTSLLQYSSGQNPAIAQKQARMNFANEVRQSKLSLRSPSVPLPHTGTYVILGIASYSVQELNLLDEVDMTLESRNGEMPSVTVFDVLDCPRMENFDSFIPGFDSVYQTPILGLAIDGQIVQRVSGLANVEEALRRLHVLDWPTPTVPSSGS